MKILFITSLLGKEYGGAELSTRLLLEKLIEEGHDVRALTTRKVKKDPRLISISFPIEIPKKLLTLGNGIIDNLLARKIRKYIKRIQPDVIHIQDTYILPATVLANKSFNVPIVATIRNSVLDSTWEMMFSLPLSTMLKRRNKTIIKALREVNNVISVSDYIKTELIQRGIESEKIFTIFNLPPIFNKANVQIHDRGNSVVHLFAPGFLATFKGFFVLIKAMKKVSECNPDVDLIIAGNGPEKKRLEKMTKQLTITSKVDFVGKILFKEVPRLYSNSDIVIFPSIYPEPFGRVALEAMFFGKPVVASRVGGIPEVVEDNKTGILVAPEESELLAQAIIILVKNPALRKLFGRNGKSVIESKFEPQKILKKHEQVYEIAIGFHRLTGEP